MFDRFLILIGDVIATTTIEILCRVGTTQIYAQALPAGNDSVIGSGTATGSPYTPSQVAGQIHTISVTDALVGRWLFTGSDTDGTDGITEVLNLTDTAERFSLGEDRVSEPGQATPAATATLKSKVAYLYKAWRNKKTQTATEFNLFADDGTTVDQQATVSDDGTTATIGEIAQGS